MRLKLKSDGTPVGTQVLVVDDQGVEHPIGATAIHVQIDVHSVRASVSFAGIEVDVEADPSVLDEDSAALVARSLQPVT